MPASRSIASNGFSSKVKLTPNFDFIQIRRLFRSLGSVSQSPALLVLILTAITGGRGGFFKRVAFPETVELLTRLGSPLKCLHVHFLDTGDCWPGAGVNDPWAQPVTGGRRNPGVPKQ